MARSRAGVREVAVVTDKPSHVAFLGATVDGGIDSDCAIRLFGKKYFGMVRGRDRLPFWAKAFSRILEHFFHKPSAPNLCLGRDKNCGTMTDGVPTLLAG